MCHECLKTLCQVCVYLKTSSTPHFELQIIVENNGVRFQYGKTQSISISDDQHRNNCTLYGCYDGTFSGIPYLLPNSSCSASQGRLIIAAVKIMVTHVLYFLVFTTTSLPVTGTSIESNAVTTSLPVAGTSTGSDVVVTASLAGTSTESDAGTASLTGTSTNSSSMFFMLHC